MTAVIIDDEDIAAGYTLESSADNSSLGPPPFLPPVSSRVCWVTPRSQTRNVSREELCAQSEPTLDISIDAPSSVSCATVFLSSRIPYCTTLPRPPQSAVFRFTEACTVDASVCEGNSSSADQQLSRPLPEINVLPLKASCVSVDGPFCRICHEGVSFERLVSPCWCRGTVGLIHKSCVERWLSVANRNHCELCGFRYNTVRRQRTFKEWLTQPDQVELRNFVADICWGVALTILTGVCSGWCLEGAIRSLSTPNVSESVALFVLSGVLLFVYVFWCMVSAYYHRRVFVKWRRANEVVTLVLNSSAAVTAAQTTEVSATQLPVADRQLPAVEHSTHVTFRPHSADHQCAAMKRAVLRSSSDVSLAPPRPESQPKRGATYADTLWAKMLYQLKHIDGPDAWRSSSDVNLAPPRPGSQPKRGATYADTLWAKMLYQLKHIDGPDAVPVFTRYSSSGCSNSYSSSPIASLSDTVVDCWHTLQRSVTACMPGKIRGTFV